MTQPTLLCLCCRGAKGLVLRVSGRRGKSVVKAMARSKAPRLRGMSDQACALSLPPQICGPAERGCARLSFGGCEGCLCVVFSKTSHSTFTDICGAGAMNWPRQATEHVRSDGTRASESRTSGRRKKKKSGASDSHEPQAAEPLNAAFDCAPRAKPRQNKSRAGESGTSACP